MRVGQGLGCRLAGRRRSDQRGPMCGEGGGRGVRRGERHGPSGGDDAGGGPASAGDLGWRERAGRRRQHGQRHVEASFALEGNKRDGRTGSEEPRSGGRGVCGRGNGGDRCGGGRGVCSRVRRREAGVSRQPTREGSEVSGEVHPHWITRGRGGARVRQERYGPLVARLRDDIGLGGSGHVGGRQQALHSAQETH